MCIRDSIEAGFIGLMGGAAGLLLSYGVSSLINKFLGSGLMGMGGGGGDISRIPISVSYTHLDVYKRQARQRAVFAASRVRIPVDP